MDDRLAVDLGRKYKAPRLKILRSGLKEPILRELRTLVGIDKRIMYAVEQAGNWGVAVVGDYGTAKAGHYGTALAGDYGTAKAECEGTAIVGIGGVATAGISGILIFRAKSGVPVSFSVDGQKVKADRAYTFLGDQLAEVPGLDPIYRS